MLTAAARPKLLVLALIAAFGAVLVASAGASPSAPATSSYIVVLKDSVKNPAAEATAEGLSPSFVYRYALKGYAAQMTADKASAMAASSNVRFVEPDGIAHAVTTQNNATWGLDRIDQHNLPLNNQYTYNATGAGVKAYIIDTGIRVTHIEFGGRASRAGTTSIDEGTAPT